MKKNTIIFSYQIVSQIFDYSFTKELFRLILYFSGINLEFSDTSRFVSSNPNLIAPLDRFHWQILLYAIPTFEPNHTFINGLMSVRTVQIFECSRNIIQQWSEFVQFVEIGIAPWSFLRIIIQV